MTRPPRSDTVARIMLLDPVPGRRARACAGAALSAGLLGGAVVFLAWRTLGGVVARLGHPGAPLDDAYIHFQYARAIAEGHPFRYFEGAPLTSGCTSVLWPLLLAPFYALGCKGAAILIPAWAIGFAALALLAHEARALIIPLAGPQAAWSGAAMVVAFSALTWCAASGMEIVPFAWVLARTVRRASEWAELPPDEPARARRARVAELCALAWAAALLRPEGSAFALLAGLTLTFFGRPVGRWRWPAVLVCALASGGVPLLLLALTGSARSNTAVAKLLIGNPYYRGERLASAVLANGKLLATTLLDGRLWSAEFVPTGGAPIAWAGLGALLMAGVRSRLAWRTFCVTALALGVFIPCFYLTFLVNRLRYLWPFAAGWVVGLACLAALVGDALGRIHRSLRHGTIVFGGAIAVLFASHLGGAIDDVVQSANGIEGQQVTVAKWIRAELPSTARVGVNDTGAIAYFGDRPTFDVVGLTTEDEAHYWLAGPASRLEHYERLHARAPALLPTHFAVYPEWMACDAVLGPQLAEATVTDATILGAPTMRVHAASYTLLGTGESPWTDMPVVVDALDVADLESEAEHGYALLAARDGEQTASVGQSPDGRTVADGGRTHRVWDRFEAHLSEGRAIDGVVRMAPSTELRVHVRAGAKEVAAFEARAGDWGEYRFRIPAPLSSARTAIELWAERGTMTTYHYWFAPVEK